MCSMIRVFHVSMIIFIQHVLEKVDMYCMRAACLHVLPTGPNTVAHVSLLLIVNED